LAGGALVIVFLALLGTALYRAIVPPTPTAFYSPPDPLSSTAPGSILRVEEITEHLPVGAKAWRVLYTSTDRNGNPTPVSGVIVAPADAVSAPRPVVAWAHGTIGIVPNCAPSLMRDPFAGIPEVARLIQEGYVIAATDYFGLGTPGVHSYLIGHEEATAVLDSVRAAHDLEIGAGEEFVIWGESQGGHAALWAAQMADSYLPEFRLAGTAAAAPAADLPGIFAYGMDKRAGAIVISEALYAWSHLYGEVDLDQLVDPSAREQFEKIARTCITTPLAFRLAGEVPTPQDFLMTDPLADETLRAIMDSNIPRGPLTAPLLLSHGTADQLIPFEGSVKEAERRCAAQEDVTFVRYPGVGHPATKESAIMTIGWFEDRLAGRQTGSTC